MLGFVKFKEREGNKEKRQENHFEPTCLHLVIPSMGSPCDVQVPPCHLQYRMTPVSLPHRTSSPSGGRLSLNQGFVVSVHPIMANMAITNAVNPSIRKNSSLRSFVIPHPMYQKVTLSIEIERCFRIAITNAVTDRYGPLVPVCLSSTLKYKIVRLFLLVIDSHLVKGCLESFHVCHLTLSG